MNGHWFKGSKDSPRVVLNRQIFLFESAESKAQFDKAPEKYVLPFRK